MNLKKQLEIEARLDAIERRLAALEGPEKAIVDEVFGELANTVEIVRTGQGRFNVTVGGKVVNDEPMLKAEAEAKKAELEAA